MAKKITREMVDEATVPTLKDYCEQMGLTVKSSDRKDNLVRKLKLAIGREEKASKAIEDAQPKTAPAPAPAAPAATVADEPKAPVVEPGSVKPLKPIYVYLQGGNGWSKECSREEAVAKAVKLGASPKLIDRLEREATTATCSRWRTSVPMRGRLPASFFIKVSVKLA